jgi:hypothetical protein
MSTQRIGRALAVAAVTLVAVGCDRADRAPLRLMTDSAIEFVAMPFERIYQTFCIRRSMPQGPKAALWHDDFAGKWVRWTGRIVSFTQSGITVRETQFTATYDVSLMIEADSRVGLQERFRRGQRITYVGRLDSYDDVFRTLYLTHGAVVGPAEPGADLNFDVPPPDLPDGG